MLRGLPVTLSLLLVLVGCSGPDGPQAEPSAPSSPKPTDRSGLVDIGERSLFLECRGSGSPTVVLEAGLTGEHHTWENVVPELRSQTRVCAYDRANTGSSEPAPTPRTARDMVADLDALLAASKERSPYVLVGFSFGGLVTQLYAATHPDEVAGVVLVDSNHPDETRQFDAHLTRAQIAEDRAAVADNPEGADVFGSLDEVRAAGGLPPVPLVVVTAGKSDGWPPGWNARLFDRLRAEQQKDLAAMAPGGRQVMARRSHHNIPIEQPRVVVNAVTDVVADAR